MTVYAPAVAALANHAQRRPTVFIGNDSLPAPGHRSQRSPLNEGRRCSSAMTGVDRRPLIYLDTRSTKADGVHRQ